MLWSYYFLVQTRLTVSETNEEWDCCIEMDLRGQIQSPAHSKIYGIICLFVRFVSCPSCLEVTILDSLHLKTFSEGKETTI